jgi:hypothetical protein
LKADPLETQQEKDGDDEEVNRGEDAAEDLEASITKGEGDGRFKSAVAGEGERQGEEGILSGQVQGERQPDETLRSSRSTRWTDRRSERTWLKESSEPVFLKARSIAAHLSLTRAHGRRHSLDRNTLF